MKLVKFLGVLLCATVVIGGGGDICEPFKSTFNNFLQSFYEAVSARKATIMDDMANFPFFNDAAKNESIAILQLYFDFFVNATADLASLDVEVVRRVALGELDPAPFPLNCFPKVFDAVKKFIKLTIEVINKPPLQQGSNSQPSPSYILNCTTIITDELQAIIAEREILKNDEAKLFPNFANYTEIISTVGAQHQYNYFLAAFAKYFHLDVEMAQQFIAGNFTDLSVLVNMTENHENDS